MTDAGMSSPEETENTVRALLRAAGVTPLEEEVAAFVDMYPGLRARADRLYLFGGERFDACATEPTKR
jgi:hypothetical protein